MVVVIGNFIDLTGQKFGRLTVLKRDGYDSRGKRILWLCKCDCGNTVRVAGGNLKNGNTQSCGCYFLDRVTKHGGSKKEGNKYRLYKIWSDMKARCSNPNEALYKNYGARGILVCDEWKDSFETFCEWAVENGYDYNAPRGECTLDRIDVNGNYCPENCRWIPINTQQYNKTTSRVLEYNGEKHALAEWADILGIKQTSLSSRINNLNWSIEDAFTIPIGKYTAGQRQKEMRDKEKEYGTGT